MPHLEVERKYDVEPDFVLPDLSSVPGAASVDEPVEHELDATYYDTDELHLSRHGVTLRRRTGGHDAGWHLKRPAGAGGAPEHHGARTELRAPLDEGERAEPAEPPASFADELRALTRGHPLRPVAGIRTRRLDRVLRSDSGRALAEVSDDHVTAHTYGDTVTTSEWREVEVELVEGSADLLDAAERLLLDAGARPAAFGSKLARTLDLRRAGATRTGRPAGRTRSGPGSDEERAWSAVATYIADQRDAIITLDPGVRHGDPEAVHKLRVACRRLRSTLRTFRPFLDRARTDPLGVELRWLAGELGLLRDSQVQAERLRAAIEAEPTELVIGPVERRIGDHFATEAGQARQRVAEALDSPRYSALLDSLDALVEATAGQEAAAAELRKRARKALRRVDRRLDRAAALSTRPAATPSVIPPLPGVVRDRTTALHEARKAAKRARYAAEALTAVGGKDARRLVKDLKRLQTVLGAHQDSVVARQTLREVGVRAHLDHENAFTYGLLHAREQAAAERVLADLPAVERTIRRKKARRWLG
ncbi:CHAD domain-containing protein [Actinopolymorpha cephalotaxi]|uniref:CHAD domain-containing protein n=1 Tax=Actinopolymorpha cephalotaxi TaxID=504797 RepID=A0A1I2YJJ3_9ACTN|nr:CYTH and CHAD domain-containing protein [Actinopolymorpha cephalotaxi]NYH86940.1 CHAD domain-containing protein [Actinopolymorpha cephalotaxi]SFH25697.1 CHAD domain-containing protein [Actinopolymorpha cephalotaxi]